MNDNTTNTNQGDETSSKHNLTQNSAGEEKLRHDIAQILEEVKLPERKQFSGEGDAAQKDSATLQQKISTEIGARNKELPNKASVLDATVHSSDDAAQKKKDFIIRPLRTLKDDLGTIAQSKKMSLVRATALESDKVRPQKEQVQEALKTQRVRTKRRTGVMVGIILLIGIGMLALGAVFLVESQRRLDVTVPQSDSLMFAEQTLPLSMDDLAPREAKLLLSQARDQASVTLGSITRIVPTVTVPATENEAAYERAITSSEFLDVIGSRAPDELLRAIGDAFFLGIHAADKTAPVTVFTVSSYERAFAAMLAWESSMSDGLAPFYPAVLQEARAQGNTLSVVDFEDAVIRNFDARILKDSTGEVRLLYAFPTRNILIIAESPYSFVEALSRLQAERRL